MKKQILMLFCMLLTTAYAFAQNKTVSGVVVNASDNQPVVGASVVVVGNTKSGTSTNSEGKYTISVAKNATSLTVSAIGYTSQTVKIPAAGSLNVSLESSDAKLDEVVVTALGVKKNRNQVAYATQTVSAEQLTENRNFNVAQSLSGKVSGIQIAQNNTLGGSTNVVIRGMKSISGDNQALFVIDGVPVANTNTNSTSQMNGRGGYDFGNPASDINPDDVESMQVLKGAAASALYGSRGSNGVILITTKKGSKTKGWGVTFNSTLTYSAADKSTFPTYQKQYGAGYGEYYGPDEDAYFNQSKFYPGQLVAPLTEDASFGAPFDPNLNVLQWDSYAPTSPNYGKATPWVAAKNDPFTFLQKPISNTQSIILTNSYDQGSFKMGYSRDDQNGILPNSNVTKNIVDFGATYKILDNLVVSGNINYYNIKGLGRYGTGYQGDFSVNPMTNFREWWQTNVDINQLKDAYFKSGGQNVTWNWANENATTPIFWNNPYFDRYQSYESDERNRYLGNINLDYKVNDWLSLTGQYTLDTYNQLQEERSAVGTVGLSGYRKFLQSYSERNINFYANFDKKISNDFSFKGLLGANLRRNYTNNTDLRTNGGLVVPGIYSLSNTKNPITSTPLAPIEQLFQKEVNGVFASSTLSYRNFLTVDASIRRDVSSTLPKGNNVYYYPSVSGGFVFSELLKSAKWLNYGKLTANYAEVGNDAATYSVYDTYNATSAIGGQNIYVARTTKNNRNLLPERTKSKEVGLELQLLDNRLGVNASYYYTKTVNQVLPIGVSTATGYRFKYINAGSMRNRGLELSINGTPVKTHDFQWDVTVNWTRNRNKVLELYKDAISGVDVTNIQTGSFNQGVTLNATVGYPYGTLRGTDFVYLNGQKVVNPEFNSKGSRTSTSGTYKVSSSSNNIIGNVQPDWAGGINNKFKYKNVSLSFLVDSKIGGDIFSLDMAYGLATGLYPETAGNNELGNPSRLPLSQGGGVIFPGVQADGTKNTVRADNSSYGTYGYVRNPNAAFVYDASFVKLRELVLGYQLPKKLVAKLGPVKGVDFSLVGRNLWIIYKNLPYADPEVGTSFGNVSGFQVGAYPNVRTFSFNIKVNF